MNSSWFDPQMYLQTRPSVWLGLSCTDLRCVETCVRLIFLSEFQKWADRKESFIDTLTNCQPQSCSRKRLKAESLKPRDKNQRSKLLKKKSDVRPRLSGELISWLDSWGNTQVEKPKDKRQNLGNFVRSHAEKWWILDGWGQYVLC